MIPTLIGSSVAQVNLLFDSVIATFLISGSVTWLYYSDRLLEFPLGVLGVALSTVILPNLSRKFAQRSPKAFSATIDWALRIACVITIPAAIGLALLAKPILITLFQYEAFDLTDVDMAALSLVAYSLGLPAFIAVKIFAPGFYARQDTATPVRIAIKAMVANMVLNIIFVGALLATQFKGPHTGLALASSVAAYINASLLYRSLHKEGHYIAERGWFTVLLSVAGASLVMVALLWWQYGELVQWVSAAAFDRAARLVILIAIGMAGYGVSLVLFGLRPRHLTKGAS